MFSAALAPKYSYTDPWIETFDQRLAALGARGRRIAYYYHQPDTSTFRYRVYNMMQALNHGGGSDSSASWFQRSELPAMDRFIDRADALVLCRTQYSPVVGRMISRAKARNIPVFFDIDDFVFNPDYAHLVMHTLDQHVEAESALDFWFAYFARHGATLRMCDAAITTNPFLADRLAEAAPGIRVAVVPNFLNAVQQGFASELYRAKVTSAFLSDGRIHIGYFSGTPTHNRDFAVAAMALARLMDHDERIVLRIVGFVPPNQALSRHANRIDVHPLQDFMNLQRLIAECEVNLVPLQNNVFTNCKSELKYFEAAIAGTVTIASPTQTYRSAIADGDDGFLAGPHQWEERLRQAISLLDERQQYAAMAGRAFDHVSQAYGWDSHARAIEQAVFG